MVVSPGIVAEVEGIQVLTAENAEPAEEEQLDI
jgi:hypothetical protein